MSKDRVYFCTWPYCVLVVCHVPMFAGWLTRWFVRSLVGEPKIDISTLVIGERYSVNHLTEA